MMLGFDMMAFCLPIYCCLCLFDLVHVPHDIAFVSIAEGDEDEDRSRYTSRLGLAHRRGDDLRDLLHDFSREAWFPRPARKVRARGERQERQREGDRHTDRQTHRDTLAETCHLSC